METATLGGGCFWCLEAVYLGMKGVTAVRSGYMGGHTDNPTYEQVCTGRSGHVEITDIDFDPAITTFTEILDVFFTIHDPTTLDRQGNDVGPQYRSVIFHRSEEQRRIAAEKINEVEAAGTWNAPLVTALEPATKFWPAESYHDDYYRNHQSQSYCVFVVAPKVEKFRTKFQEKVRAES